MKSLVFYAPTLTSDVESIIKYLKKSLQCTINIISDKDTSEYFAGLFDVLFVVDDYTFFLKYPVNASKVYIWVSDEFKHPVYVGHSLEGLGFLSNIVHDGIIHSRNMRGGSCIPETLQGWADFLEIADVQNKEQIGVLCNWTQNLARDWDKLIPPEYPYEVIDGEVTGKTFVFNECSREPKSDDIFLTMEPSCNRDHHSSIWSSKQRNIQRNMTEWHLNLSWEQLESSTFDKTKNISAIVSGENRLYGHKKRLELINYLDNHLVFDLYGRYPHKLQNYKGSLVHKDDGPLKYTYHIAVENCSEDGYFTEKLTDGILAECLCFYWGCSDIDKYVDPRAYILLPIEDPAMCLNIISETILSDEYSKRLPFIRNEKWRIMNGWSIFPTIQRYLQGIPEPSETPYIVNQDFEEWKIITRKMAGKTYRRVAHIEDVPEGALVVQG